MRYHSLLPEQEIWKDYGWTCVESVSDELEPIDIVVGSDDDRTGQDYFHLVDRVRPCWFVYRCDPSLLAQAEGRHFGLFLMGMANIGYHLCWRVLDAELFGRPPARHVYLVGYYGEDKDCASQALFDPYQRNYPFEYRRCQSVLDWIGYNIMQYDERYYLPW